MKYEITKKQAAGLIKVELEKSYLSIQVLAFFLLLIVINTVFFVGLFNVLFSVIGLMVLYLEYKRLNSRLLELKEKWGVKNE
jgi:predicted membrane protein